ncbi:MAG: DUF1840 domain-containing protein [Nitrosospira sp.]|nr:DUF1840 domain-containing protein [Nitrosospira sp.]
MLIAFKTDAYADIIMFGDVAQQLLKMMGHSGTVPSAILAEDVPAALERLKRAVEVKEESIAEPEPASGPAKAPDKDDSQAVSLAYRALPLIELLTAAAKKHRDVMWNEL